MMVAKLFIVPVALIVCMSLTGNRVPPDNHALLNHRVTMQVHSAEILESVVGRLNTRLGGRITWDTRMLSPYKAKAATYQQTAVSAILDDQLSGKPIRYKEKRGKILIYPGSGQ